MATTVGRCTCGYTKFARRTDRETDPDAQRWRPVEGEDEEPAWGRFEISVTTGVANTVCENCQRVRRAVPVGGGVVMAAFVDDVSVEDTTLISAVMSDVVDPSCMAAAFESTVTTQKFSVAIEVTVDDIPVVEGSPLEVSETLPPGAQAAMAVYTVVQPAPDEAGEELYNLVFRDRCLGIAQFVAAAQLFSSMTMYGRSGDVVAELGDYTTSLIEADEGVTLKDDLEDVAAEILTKAEIAGDLGGTPAAPLVIGLQGRAVSAAEPEDQSQLLWFADEEQWEPWLPPPAAALTPVEGGAWGQWSLDFHDMSYGTAGGIDRTGNNHDIGMADAKSLRDLRPYPARSYGPDAGGFGTAATGQYGDVYPGTSVLMDEFTFTYRAWWRHVRAGGRQVAVGADGYQLLYVEEDGSLGQLIYLNGDMPCPTLRVIARKWYWFSIRRASSGALTFGLDDQFVTVAAPHPGPVYTRISLGSSLSYGGGTIWQGAVADLSCWDYRRTDVDVLRNYRTAMGR